MDGKIDGLLALCEKQPFDVKEIEAFIRENKMNSEEITRTAIRLADDGFCSYGDYLYTYEKEPLPGELITYNWEALFNVLIENGLDANMVFCDDGMNYENILQSVMYFDDGDLSARVARNILRHTGTPNVIIDGRPFFEEVNLDFIWDMEMRLYYYKWQEDNIFRFWLVLMGFGGVTENGKLSVTLYENMSPERFREFEKFDYRTIYKDNDFELQIIDKATGKVVATA